MSENILVPVLGESVTEATVARWLKKEGEHVAVDEPVVELETDKVNLEVPSPVSGVIEKINSKDGENVEVGSVLGTVSNETKNISFLIVEGIFAKEFANTLNNQNYYFLEIKTKKKECMKRVVQRDLKERGKDKIQAENDFLKSWEIYYEKFKPNSIKNNTNKFIIEKNTDLDNILKKLFN